VRAEKSCTGGKKTEPFHVSSAKTKKKTKTNQNIPLRQTLKGGKKPFEKRQDATGVDSTTPGKDEGILSGLTCKRGNRSGHLAPGHVFTSRWGHQRKRTEDTGVISNISNQKVGGCARPDKGVVSGA